MWKARGQDLLDAAMTRGAELGLFSGQQWAVVGGVGRMADQAFAFYGGHVARPGGFTWCIVAVETETGTDSRSSDRLRFCMAAVAGELGMNGRPEQPFAGRAVWGVAARAVRFGHRETPMSGSKAIGRVMTTSAQHFAWLVQKCRLIGSVWAMAGQTVVGHRSVENREEQNPICRRDCRRSTTTWFPNPLECRRNQPE